MHEARILELEQLLVIANDSLAKLTATNADLTVTNADLTEQVADAEKRNKKLRRSSRNGESVLKQQLTEAQNRRF